MLVLAMENVNKISRIHDSDTYYTRWHCNVLSGGLIMKNIVWVVVHNINRKIFTKNRPDFCKNRMRKACGLGRGARAQAELELGRLVNRAGNFPINYINWSSIYHQSINQSITLSGEFKLQWKWLLTTIGFCLIIAVFRVRRWTVTQCTELVFHISVSLQRTIYN